MKKYAICLSALLFSVLLITGGCNKSDDDDPDNGLSGEINSIISQQIIDDLTSRGMTINKGSNPPSVQGIFLISPFTLSSPYGASDPWSAGQVISDYKYKLYDQTGDKVKMDYKSLAGVDFATGVASLLSGSENKFTLFAQTTGSSSGVSYKSVSILSGEITSTGIKDFQYAFVYTEKNGDPNNTILIPVGSSRIWKDGDNLAVPSDMFRLMSNGPGLKAGTGTRN